MGRSTRWLAAAALGVTAARASAGHTQQVVYGRLAVREQWRERCWPLVPPDVHPLVDANVRAVDLTRQASADVAANGGPVRELPDWRIVGAAPPAELLAEYRSAEARGLRQRDPSQLRPPPCR